MNLFQKTKDFFRIFKAGTGLDEASVNIFGINAKLVRKTSVPIPHEVSIFIPRLEINKKFIEGNKCTETTLVLNSLTIVSAPRHEPLGPGNKLKDTTAQHHFRLKNGD
ncbi:hypothetical protein [Phosphitispora sp. TUW77]|uniref:hypothetical protein n=1 Tax=Phosphitispora sp. TUW77 TaxID=3152361 RepID=UPI003AB859A1